MLETREEDGQMVKQGLAQHALIDGFRHARLDVGAFLLDRDATEAVQQAGVTVLRMEGDATAGEAERWVGNDVRIGGFRLIGSSGEGTEAVVPTVVDGSVREVAGARGFIDTGDVTCEMGMCGGPVVLATNPEVCVGMLEGVVPRVEDGVDGGETHRRLQGMAVFVGGHELNMFLREVETAVRDHKSSS